MAPPIFPNNLWDGKSLERANILIHRPPGPEDWNQIVAEVMALEQYALYLKNLINNFSGGAPGGVSGQIQFNNNGSFAGFNGHVAVSDTNGLTDAVAIGSGSFVLGEQSLAIGYRCIASTDQSIALGYQCVAGDLSRACTINGVIVTIPSGDFRDWFYNDSGALVLSQLIGGTGPDIVYGTVRSQTYTGGNTILTLVAPITTHTSGYVNMRNNNTSAYAEGYYTSAFGLSSHAEGSYNIASGTGSHVEGNSTVASGFASHSEGSRTTTSGTASHAEGNTTISSGAAAHAEGYNTIASGFSSHSEGSYTSVTGNSSHAEGNSTAANSNSSHAEGSSTIANGNFSHAEGSSTTANGNSSHAEGSFTTASGNASHAEGNSTITSAAYCHAGGNGAIASLPCQWVRSDGVSIPGQIGHIIASGLSTSSTPVTLLINRTDVISVPTNRAYSFIVNIVGYKIDGSKIASFLRRGIIANIDGTTSLIGSINIIGTDNNIPSWSVTITVDNSNNALKISVIGEETVNWRALIDFVEVGI